MRDAQYEVIHSQCSKCGLQHRDTPQSMAYIMKKAMERNRAYGGREYNGTASSPSKRCAWTGTLSDSILCENMNTDFENRITTASIRADLAFLIEQVVAFALGHV